MLIHTGEPIRVSAFPSAPIAPAPVANPGLAWLLGIHIAVCFREDVPPVPPSCPPDPEEIAAGFGVDVGVVQFGQREPERGGDTVRDDVRLTAGQVDHESDVVTWHKRWLYRNALEIGSVDFWACHTCRRALLGEIGIVEPEQRRGLGSRVLRLLRSQLEGYTWCTTAAKTGSEQFWARMRRDYPGEYYDHGDGGDDLGRACAHIDTVM